MATGTGSGTIPTAVELDRALSAIEQATMPDTAAEAEALYCSYAAPGDRRVAYKGGVLHNQQPVMIREQWLATTFGIRWDALSR